MEEVDMIVYRVKSSKKQVFFGRPNPIQPDLTQPSGQIFLASVSGFRLKISAHT